MTNEEAPPLYFGLRWQAPIVDEAEPVATPVGATCLWCEEAIQEGDQGTVKGRVVIHRECGLRSVVGGIGRWAIPTTHEDLGPDAGLSRRVSACLVWKRFMLGEVFTAERLARLRDEQ